MRIDLVGTGEDDDEDEAQAGGATAPNPPIGFLTQRGRADSAAAGAEEGARERGRLRGQASPRLQEAGWQHLRATTAGPSPGSLAEKWGGEKIKTWQTHVGGGGGGSWKSGSQVWPLGLGLGWVWVGFRRRLNCTMPQLPQSVQT